VASGDPVSREGARCGSGQFLALLGPNVLRSLPVLGVHNGSVAALSGLSAVLAAENR
jgi:hypothetical protein